MARLFNLYFLFVFYALKFLNYVDGFEEDDESVSYIKDSLTSDEQISLDIMKLKALALPDDFYNDLDDNIKEWNIEENPDLDRFYLNNNDIFKKRTKLSNIPLSLGGTHDNNRDKISICQTIVSEIEHQQEGYKFYPSRYLNFTCVAYSHDSPSTDHKHICLVRSTGGGADDCKTHYKDGYVLKKEVGPSSSSCWQPEKFRIPVGCKCSVGLCSS